MDVSAAAPDVSLTPIAAATERAKAKQWVGHCTVRLTNEDAKFIRLLAAQLSVRLPEAATIIVNHYRACVARGGATEADAAAVAARVIAQQVVDNGVEPMVSEAGEELAPIIRQGTPHTRLRGTPETTLPGTPVGFEADDAPALASFVAHDAPVNTDFETTSMHHVAVSKDTDMLAIEREVAATRKDGTFAPTLVLHRDAGEFPVWPGSGEQEWPRAQAAVADTAPTAPTEDDVAAALADIEAARIVRGQA